MNNQPIFCRSRPSPCAIIATLAVHCVPYGWRIWVQRATSKNVGLMTHSRPESGRLRPGRPSRRVFSRTPGRVEKCMPDCSNRGGSARIRLDSLIGNHGQGAPPMECFTRGRFSDSRGSRGTTGGSVDPWPAQVPGRRLRGLWPNAPRRASVSRSIRRRRTRHSCVPTR